LLPKWHRSHDRFFVQQSEKVKAALVSKQDC
jgi:hypothetical protein